MAGDLVRPRIILKMLRCRFVNTLCNIIVSIQKLLLEVFGFDFCVENTLREPHYTRF